jgi:hypothetical protein
MLKKVLTWLVLGDLGGWLALGVAMDLAGKNSLSGYTPIFTVMMT